MNLGDTFIGKIRQKLRGAIVDYCQQAWGAATECLETKDEASLVRSQSHFKAIFPVQTSVDSQLPSGYPFCQSDKVLKKNLKNRFRTFNSCFGRTGGERSWPAIACSCLVSPVGLCTSFVGSAFSARL